MAKTAAQIYRDNLLGGNVAQMREQNPYFAATAVRNPFGAEDAETQYSYKAKTAAAGTTFASTMQDIQTNIKDPRLQLGLLENLYKQNYFGQFSDYDKKQSNRVGQMIASGQAAMDDEVFGGLDATDIGMASVLAAPLAGLSLGSTAGTGAAASEGLIADALASAVPVGVSGAGGATSTLASGAAAGTAGTLSAAAGLSATATSGGSSAAPASGGGPGTTAAAKGFSTTDALLAASLAPQAMSLFADAPSASAQDIGASRTPRTSTVSRERDVETRRQMAGRAASAAGVTRSDNDADLLGKFGLTTARRRAGQARQVLGY